MKSIPHDGTLPCQSEYEEHYKEEDRNGGMVNPGALGGGFSHVPTCKEKKRFPFCFVIPICCISPHTLFFSTTAMT